MQDRQIVIQMTPGLLKYPKSYIPLKALAGMETLAGPNFTLIKASDYSEL